MTSPQPQQHQPVMMAPGAVQYVRGQQSTYSAVHTSSSSNGGAYLNLLVRFKGLGIRK